MCFANVSSCMQEQSHNVSTCVIACCLSMVEDSILREKYLKNICQAGDIIWGRFLHYVQSMENLVWIAEQMNFGRMHLQLQIEAKYLAVVFFTTDKWDSFLLVVSEPPTQWQHHHGPRHDMPSRWSLPFVYFSSRDQLNDISRSLPLQWRKGWGNPVTSLTKSKHVHNWSKTSWVTLPLRLL